MRMATSSASSETQLNARSVARSTQSTASGKKLQPSATTPRDHAAHRALARHTKRAISATHGIEGGESRTRYSILVVADVASTRGLIADILRRKGYWVVEAEDALEAQGIAKSEQRIDMLFADLSSPESNLLELVAWFHGVRSETRMLVASNSFWEVTYHLGVGPEVCLIAKPFSATELTRMVRQVLR